MEAIGAVQAQYRPAMPVALWTRLRSFDTADLHTALDRRELVLGTLLRATLHLVSAREHRYYSAVAEESGATGWRRVGKDPVPDMERLRADMFEFAVEPRSAADLTGFVEDWISRHGLRMDKAELEHQRKYGWRALLRSSRFVRVATDGAWSGARPVEAYVAAPGDQVTPEAALDEIVRCHLRAFGPASAPDIAAWTGFRVAPVRAAVARLETDLVQVLDEAGRSLHDLQAAPRPGADLDAPVRFLPWFDSVLLAYEPAHRSRILPSQHRDRVYLAKNLQWLPTVLVDGLVAGTWSVQSTKRLATLKVEMFGRLGRERAELLEEAERLVRFLRPQASTHEVKLA